jgi:hypothetical protein
MENLKELEELKKEVPEFKSLDLSRVYIKKGKKAICEQSKPWRRNFLFFLGNSFASLFPLSPLFFLLVIFTPIFVILTPIFKLDSVSFAIFFITFYIIFIFLLGFVYLRLNKIGKKDSSFDYFIIFLSKKALAHELTHMLLHKKELEYETHFEGFWGGFKWLFFNFNLDLEVIGFLKRYRLNGRLEFLQYLIFKWYRIIGNTLNI